MTSCGKALLLLLLSSPAYAQRFEAAGLVGYTTRSSLETVAPGLQSLDIQGGFTWAAQFAYFFSPRFGVEASFARREDPLTLSTSDGTGELFDIDSRQLLGSVVYRFGNENVKLRPFLLGGLGATFFRAEDIPSETKLAWAVGGGVSMVPWPRFGFKLQAKFSPTALNDKGSDFCDPFGFCSSAIQPFELLGGIVFRF
jgi:opacity protein-like surface antigen